MPSTLFPDLISVIESSSLGLSYGANLFKGSKANIPNGNGPYVSLIRAGGLGSEDTHNSTDGPAYERPNVQVLTRATNYDDAERLAQALYDLLWPIQNQFINGTWWRQVSLGDLFDLPPDEKGRPRIGFTISCVKRTSPATS